MASPSVLQSQQSVSQAAPAGKVAAIVGAAAETTGMWAMEPQEVLSLFPRAPALVRVTHGRIWATLNGSHSGPANAWGDVFLEPGQVLEPGQGRVVTARRHPSLGSRAAARARGPR